MSLLKKITVLLISIFILPILYFLTAKVLTFFPTQTLKDTQQTHKIYLLYGKMHSDIVLNIQDLNASWFKYIKPIQHKQKGYLAIGWGDKESYLYPDTIVNLPIDIILKALFLNTSSLLRVAYYEKIDGFQYKTLSLSKQQLSKLHRTLFKDFDFTGETFSGYHHNDYYYSSRRTYNAINTCNTWTGDHLRNANVTMSYWTPLRENITDLIP